MPLGPTGKPSKKDSTLPLSNSAFLSLKPPVAPSAAGTKQLFSGPTLVVPSSAALSVDLRVQSLHAIWNNKLLGDLMPYVPPPKRMRKPSPDGAHTPTDEEREAAKAKAAAAPAAKTAPAPLMYEGNFTFYDICAVLIPESGLESTEPRVDDGAQSPERGGAPLQKQGLMLSLQEAYFQGEPTNLSQFEAGLKGLDIVTGIFDPVKVFDSSKELELDFSAASPCDELDRCDPKERQHFLVSQAVSFLL